MLGCGSKSSRAGGESGNGNGNGGCEVCGVCRVCTCCRTGVLTTPVGVAKTTETVVSVGLSLLLFRYGAKYSSELGAPFAVLLTASSAAAVNSPVSLACYVSSARELALGRTSLKEIVTNLVLAAAFLASSSVLTFSVHDKLFYFFNTMPEFSAYPAMTAAYVSRTLNMAVLFFSLNLNIYLFQIVGYVLGVVFAVDALLCFRDRRRLNAIRNNSR